MKQTTIQVDVIQEDDGSWDVTSHCLHLAKGECDDPQGHLFMGGEGFDLSRAMSELGERLQIKLIELGWANEQDPTEGTKQTAP